MPVVEAPPSVKAAAPPGKIVKAAMASVSAAVRVTVPASFRPKVIVPLVEFAMVS